MSRYAFALLLLLSGCVCLNRKPVEIYRPEVVVKKACAGAVPVSLTVHAIGALDTNRILYRESGKYLYYERSVWFCEPSCLVEEALRKALSVDEGAQCALDVEVLDFGPWIKGGSFGVVLRVSEALKCRGKHSKRLFYYSSTLGRTSLTDASLKLGELLSKLVEDTCRWITFEVSASSTP